MLPVFNSIGRSKFVSLSLQTKGKKFRIALSLSFVVVHTTFILYSMQFHQSENFFTDDMQVNLHVRLSKYRLNID